MDAARRVRALPLLALAAILAVACVGEFDLGVGAFEVGTDDAILWTHVDPGDAAPPAVVLSVEVATDPDFENVVRRRPVVALASNDWTARAHVTGLEPRTSYWYRFRSRGLAVQGALARVLGEGSAFERRESRVGRFRTAPAEDDRGPVRFVVSGDSNLGYTRPRGLDFYVLAAAADEDPDAFLFFGDTIYSDSGVLPTGNAVTLDEYRAVHRMTRADPSMQELIASTATLSGWDDHEVRNDYDGETVEPGRFLAGARAFFEYLPPRPDPVGEPYRTYRRLRYGRHVELFLTDGRQYRSAEQFCNETLPDGPETAETLFSPFPEDERIAEATLPPVVFDAAAPLLVPSDPDCVDALLADPARTMLGPEQLAWLEAALLDSTATFKIILNSTPISSLLFLPYDRWEGYLAEREELFEFIETNLDPRTVLILTTDFHTNLGIRRPEASELVVGPIGQQTFAQSVLSLLPPDLAPFGALVLGLVTDLIEQANGAGSALGAEADAFSYARIDVYEDEMGEPHLRATVRGDTAYADGANDPALVQDLFTFEMP